MLTVSLQIILQDLKASKHFSYKLDRTEKNRIKLLVSGICFNSDGTQD